MNGLCRYPTAPALSASAFWASPATTHHDDWRLHAKVADAFQQVETLLPTGADPWNDHVEQNEIDTLRGRMSSASVAEDAGTTS